MSNKDKSAYPIPASDMQGLGLTKLEAFTMAAMQGLLSNSELSLTPENIALEAQYVAAATLAELEADNE